MQRLTKRNDQENPNCAVVEVSSFLDSACAIAIVDKVRRCLRRGAQRIVVDLSKAKSFSLFGLAVLFDRANAAGLLSRLVFRVADPIVRQFFSTVSHVQMEGAS
jgi:anti-anti-sigma regulatory factor